MNRDFIYENNNIAYDIQCPESIGGGIKCKNYILCEAVLPNYWFDMKSHYLCGNCDSMFGTWGNPETEFSNNGKGVLDVIENLDCMICLETKTGISLPKCDHYICIDCFKRCYYGEPYPPFPYPDIQEEYYEDTEQNDILNPKWATDYPLIAVYEEEWEICENKNMSRSKDDCLSRCPLCRK
jgi:hypothetical protein